MPNPIDVLDKLRTKLFMKQMKTNVGEEIDDKFEDVPNIDDDEYKTFMRIPPVQNEQNEEDPNKETMPPEGEEEPPPEEEMPPEEPGMEDPGMGGEEEQLTSTEIGRVYELKKIFSRLTSIEAYLSDSSDLTLLKLRNYVSQALEMFEILINNIDSFKDQIDDIIIMYYKFIEMVYVLLNKYYVDQEKEDEGKVTKFK